MRKVIITAAVTGARHTPSMSPYLPVTPEMIVADAVKANQAGAAILQIHARSAKDGRPTQDLDILSDIRMEIMKQCNAVICMSTGEARGISCEERIAPIADLKPELASCSAGSLNINYADMANGIRKYKYDWEKQYLTETENSVFVNTFQGLSNYIQVMNKVKTVPVFEIYDVGMINNIAYYEKSWLIKRPLYLQFVLGVMGGIPATVDNLAYLVKTAREQLGDFIWSCAAIGENQLRLGPAALAMGGHVRVGLAENLYIRGKVLAKSSAEQVESIVGIIERTGLDIATTEDVRHVFGLNKDERMIG